MRIMHVNDQYRQEGGTEQYILSVCEELEKRGHEVSVVYQKQEEGTLSFPGRAEYHVPFAPSGQSRLALLRQVLARENPDVVHIHNVFDPPTIELLAKLKPTVRLVHDHRLYCFRESKVLPRSGRPCPYPVGTRCPVAGCTTRRPHLLVPMLRAKRRELRANRRVHRCMVHTRFMQKMLVTNGFSGRKIEVLPSFVSSEFLRQADSKNGSSDYVLFVGRLYPAKGPQLLLEAFQKVAPPTRLVVVGDGPYADELRSLTAQLGLTGRVEFVGAVGRQGVHHYYAHCIVTVIPSLWQEPFGLVGLEAMVHGKPVIAFDVGGISDWLVHEQTGLLVPPGDVASLAQAIHRVLANTEWARQLGEDGQRRARSLYTPEAHVPRLLEIYQRTASGWGS